MAVNSIIPPYPSFFDLAGVPLDSGFVYVGQPGLEAQSSPKASFFDFAMTISAGTDTGAAVRTLAGFPARNGAAAALYVDGDFSITVRDKNGVLLYSALNRTFAFGAEVAGGLPVQAPDGDFGVTGFGFIDEPNTGFVRQGAGVMQSVVLGNVISQQNAAGTSFLLPVTGAGFVSGVAAALDTDLQQLAGIVAVEGDMIFRNATTWARRAKGAAGQIIRQNDGLTAPAWSDNIASPAVQATTSGTAFDFNAIPAWVKRITVVGDQVSLSGSEYLLIQLGTATSFETTGYAGGRSIVVGGSPSSASFTNGFGTGPADGAKSCTFRMTLTRMAVSNVWIADTTGAIITAGAGDGHVFGAGSITLPSALTRVRVTRDGAGTFDAGSVSITYE